MKISNNIIAAALLGFAHQAVAEVICYDNGWDIDTSGDTMEGYIDEFCNSQDINNGFSVYDFPRSDGSNFTVDFYALGTYEAQDCKDNLNTLIGTCLDEKSGGDNTYFKGGSALNGNESISIDCDTTSCP